MSAQPRPRRSIFVSLAFAAALVGLAALFHRQLIAWFTWATAMLNHRWTTPDEVPSDLPLPGWNWDGTEGW